MSFSPLNSGRSSPVDGRSTPASQFLFDRGIDESNALFGPTRDLLKGYQTTLEPLFNERVIQAEQKAFDKAAQSAKKNYTQLEVNLETTQAQLDDVNEKFDDLQKKYLKLKEEVETRSNINDQAAESLLELNDLVLRFQEENNKLSLENATTKEDLKLAQNAVRTLERHNAQFEEELESARAKLLSSFNASEELKASNAQIMKTLSDATAKINTIENRETRSIGTSTAVETATIETQTDVVKSSNTMQKALFATTFAVVALAATLIGFNTK